MITDTLVEETWRECAGLAPAEARVKMARLGRLQPALLAYVLAASQDLTPPAAELTVYIFFVIARMFYRCGAKVRRVSPAAISSFESRIEAQVTALQGSHGAFVERAAVVLSSRQPHVYRYLVETLVESPKDSIDPVTLTPEDQGCIFLILATAITALDEKGLSERKT